MRLFVLVLPAFLVAFLLSSCELRHESRPSVLILAVEGLQFDSYSCDSDDNDLPGYSGIRTFCEEAVRFSHAFTPSTLSQPAMTSLLTGLYPFDHGVHSNGRDFLPAHFKTLAEGALDKGVRTLFVSGGPPLWRKSGLVQGFEIFDDSIDIEPGVYYRPADEVFRIFKSWLDQTDATAFMSVLFLSDLQFPQMATQTADGEWRERSASAQLDEVAESLSSLVSWLKAKKRWNSTHIVLVGLNSLAKRENDEEPPPLSLRSSSAQVTLFIKPARKERDNLIQWGVDRNVSLVDVGKTMFLWMGLPAPTGTIAELQPVSLASVLNRPEPNWDEDRMILTESGWPDWLEGSGIRVAVRKNQFLYINDRKPLIFNMLTDRLENIALRSNDPLWTSLNGNIMDTLAHSKTLQGKWQGMQGIWLEQIQVAQGLWRDNPMYASVKGSEPYSKWYLKEALLKQNWSEVKRLSQERSDPIGVYVAGVHLSERHAMPRNPCIRLLLMPDAKRNYQSECEDEGVLALHAWRSARNDDERQVTQERFLRLYAMARIDHDIGRLNFLNDLRWDVDREFPKAPSLVDYILTLKDFEPFAKKALSFVGGKDRGF